MTELRLDVDDDHSVSALLSVSPQAAACLVLAHGAGAGMHHRFMEEVAAGLLAREIATLRYQFPYMESASKRPDRPALAHATVRATVACAAQALPEVPLFAGGKSFGGRMTSQAQAEAPLPNVHGLVFFGFPLHPAGKPSTERGAHLGQVRLPMLFLQGTRDTLADAALMRATTDGLRQRATLVMVEDGDHSFHVRVRSGRTDAEVLADMLDRTADWMRGPPLLDP